MSPYKAPSDITNGRRIPLVKSWRHLKWGTFWLATCGVLLAGAVRSIYLAHHYSFSDQISGSFTLNALMFGIMAFAVSMPAIDFLQCAFGKVEYSQEMAE